MAKVTDILKANDSTDFSFEILPPVKGQSIQSLYKAIDPLMEFKPKFIDVTYHREEYVYKKHHNGFLEKIVTRKRPGTVGICAALMNRYQIETVPHLICGGFSKEETENALIDLDFLGIENVLALRGDAIKTEPRFFPEENGHQYASQLLEQVMNMNKGRYLDEDMTDASPTHFCAGIAGYPEKHFEAPNMKMDLKYLKQKVDMGAEYIVTQMFFDNSKYFEFVDNCREMGINVPIIPGLKPLTTLAQITSLPRIFHIDLPDDFGDALSGCRTNQDAKAVGVEWSIEQCKELMKAKVPCLHFYTMSRSDATCKIAEALY